MKKTLVSALTTALVVGAASTTFAAANPFEDVPADHWAYDAIAQLAADGVIEGYGDGTYRGDQEITRYEMAQMIARAMAKGGGDKALIDKLAAALGMSKAEVYREMIREIGGVSETVCVRDRAVAQLIDGWRHNGLGWFAETVPSKIPGCTNVILYYGSSIYDTAQMHALIDAVVQGCRAVGIETLPPHELAALEAAWEGTK